MTDARCLDDLDPFGAELDDPLEELFQDLYHRLIEAPGSNIDDPARGFGLDGRLSSSSRASVVLTTIETGICAEFRKDDRVLDVSASVTSSSPGAYEIAIRVVADEGVLGIKLARDGNGVRRVA
jgi:hypothetical protein